MNVQQVQYNQNNLGRWWLPLDDKQQQVESTTLTPKPKNICIHLVQKEYGEETSKFKLNVKDSPNPSIGSLADARTCYTTKTT